MKKDKAKQEVRYYKSYSDDFFRAEGDLPAVDENYKYIKRGAGHALLRFLYYRVIATPIALFHSKFILHNKYIGKKKLAAYKKQGFLVYSNHTQAIGDAFTPNALLFPKRVYVIVGKDNLALPVIGKRTAYLGALPLPDNLRAMRNFHSAVKERCREGGAIVIYPEAHVWPYYTGIRPFGDESLEFAFTTGAPVFTATRAYRSRGEGKKPRSEIYIDGPFFPAPELTKREARARLAEELMSTMRERAAISDCEYIKYIKEEDTAAES